jgi:cell division protein FtsB
MSLRLTETQHSEAVNLLVSGIQREKESELLAKVEEIDKLQKAVESLKEEVALLKNNR